MARLISPKSATIVVKYGEFWQKHKWHILKPATNHTAICGAVCLDPEYEKLGHIQAKDLCSRCWQFGKV